MKKYRVMICDDHELFRDGLRMLLESIPEIDLVGEASNGKELVAVCRTVLPDFIFTDIKMPLMDGIEATRIIKQEYADIRIIALSMFDDEQVIVDMLQAGANGYMLKNADKDEFIEAIESVYKDQIYYCKHTNNQLAKILAYSRYHEEKIRKESEFSEREKEIISLVCQEFTNKEIGEKLFLSPRTVEGYRLKIQEKLGVKNVAGVVIEAIRLGFFHPE